MADGVLLMSGSEAELTSCERSAPSVYESVAVGTAAHTANESLTSRLAVALSTRVPSRPRSML